MKTGEMIRRLREERGWSQDLLAEKMGYKGKSSISMIESGTTDLTRTKLFDFANLFGIDPIKLIMGDQLEKKDIIRVPVLGRIPAGIPLEAIEDIEDYEEMAYRPGEFFALKVKGDSMYPTINEGDIVIFKRQSTCDQDQICAVRVNGDDATLKRVQLHDGIAVLVPINPAYQTQIYDKHHPVEIIGVAVEIRRKL